MDDCLKNAASPYINQINEQDNEPDYQILTIKKLIRLPDINNKED